MLALYMWLFCEAAEKELTSSANENKLRATRVVVSISFDFTFIFLKIHGKQNKRFVDATNISISLVSRMYATLCS